MLLDAGQLDAHVPAIEAAVDATPGIDHWCSGPDWVLPVRHGFGQDATPLIVHSADGFALLARYAAEDGTVVIAGFEPLWGFACPLVGPRPGQLAADVVQHLRSVDRWDRIILPGMPADGDLARSLAGPLSALGPVGAAVGITRVVTAVSDFDQWLAGRSRVFRRNLRQAERRAADEGVTFETISDQSDLMDRLLAIERRGWKGGIDDGITSPSMEIFYRTMIERLQTAGRCRTVVARLADADIGFILGGERGRRYRGLQLSYVESARHLSIGHLLQLHEMRRVCADPGIDVYDLGMEMEYKRRWAGDEEASITLVVDRTGAG